MTTTYSNKTDEIRTKSVLKLNELIKDEKLSRKVEQSLYNYIVKLSKEKELEECGVIKYLKTCTIQK